MGGGKLKGQLSCSRIYDGLIVHSKKKTGAQRNAKGELSAPSAIPKREYYSFPLLPDDKHPLSGDFSLTQAAMSGQLHARYQYRSPGSSVDTTTVILVKKQVVLGKHR